ncbi:unnamed protein product [Owenia fusiformis]|uniref:VWFD domain-containing protein n=1 Tax=Owenia fusiformis TaxID=6347 RepID=A0A8S4Q4Q6_OWEFU|nr:unnamed protein product [Owenia fusiformis]
MISSFFNDKMLKYVLLLTCLLGESTIDALRIVDGLSASIDIRMTFGITTGWGDPHYRTFDGLDYDFQGTGKYLFVESTDGEFKVEVQNTPSVNPSVSLTLYADIYVGDDIIRLHVANTAKVNNIPVVEFPYKDGKKSYVVTQLDGITSFISPKLYFAVDMQYGISVAVGEKWKGKVDGLAKNFDGDMENDKTDRNGDDVSNMSNLGSLIGISYDVDNISRSDKVIPLNDIPPIMELCITPRQRRAAERVCQLIFDFEDGPFTECKDPSFQKRRERLIRDCTFDVCDDFKNYCNIVFKFLDLMDCVADDNFKCAEVNMTGDPHMVQPIEGSLLPLCYNFDGEMNTAYKLLMQHDNEINVEFGDGTRKITQVAIITKTVTIHLTILHVTINGVTKEWTDDNFALEGGHMEIIGSDVYLELDSGLKIHFVRSHRHHLFNMFLDEMHRIPKDASGVIGYVSNHATLEDNGIDPAQLMIDDIPIDVIKKEGKCWQVPHHNQQILNNLFDQFKLDKILEN